MYYTTHMNTLMGVYGYGNWAVRIGTFERYTQEFVARLRQSACDVDVEIVYKHSRLNYRKNAEKRLQKALAQIKREECIKVVVSGFRSGVPDGEPLGMLSLEFGYNAIREQRDESYPNKFEISFCDEQLLRPYAQPEWTEMLVDLCTVLGAATGFIDRASFMLDGTETPMEMPVCFATGVAPEKHYDKKLRGYTWGTVMTAGHIAALGGMDKAMQLPHADVKSIMINGHQALYLQATENLREFPNEKRLALKRSLEPVLYKEDLFLIAGRLHGSVGEYVKNMIALDETEHRKWDSFVDLYRQGTKSHDKRREMEEERKFFGVNQRGIIIEKEEQAE